MTRHCENATLTRVTRVTQGGIATAWLKKHSFFGKHIDRGAATGLEFNYGMFMNSLHSTAARRIKPGKRLVRAPVPAMLTMLLHIE
jgi:hypothetical protein